MPEKRQQRNNNLFSDSVRLPDGPASITYLLLFRNVHILAHFGGAVCMYYTREKGSDILCLGLRLFSSLLRSWREEKQQRDGPLARRDAPVDLTWYRVGFPEHVLEMRNKGLALTQRSPLLKLATTSGRRVTESPMWNKRQLGAMCKDLLPFDLRSCKLPDFVSGFSAQARGA